MDETRLVTDKVRAFAYGTDAGFYRLTPRLVVRVNSEDDVKAVMAACSEYGLPLTFRGNGTSLSGQAISDSVLVLVGDAWKSCKVEDEGKSISLGIKMTGGEANLALSSYGKKIGPDPASLRSATIAGIVANNASGMTCGTTFNTWNTIEGMRLILADGTVLDTRDERSRESFLKTHAEFVRKLLDLAHRAKADPALQNRILQKFRIKNTIGYSVNSLAACEDPFDIIMRLMVGSEGTLGFISEVTLKTVENLPEKATSLMAFANTDAACESLLILRDYDVSAAEFMDRRTIAAVEDLPGIPDFLKALGPEAAILLVEINARSREELLEQAQGITRALDAIHMPHPVTFSFEEAECRRLWEIREGFDPIISAKGAPGTLMISEDVAIPVERLGPAINDLYQLFDRWGYDEAVVFGHVLAGNLHFDILQNFNSAEEVKRFKGFLEGLVDLVVDKYDGSLKAEHGTGRNMAPFVAKEWGESIYGIMKEIKSLFDPAGILNPGVIFNEDPGAHASNLKRYPLVDPKVDRCIECGFCERFCVSHELTLSPRQRIVLLRQLNWLRVSGEDPQFLKELEREVPYLVLDTCATCGRCETACPSGINTGQFVKVLRTDKLGSVSKWFGAKAADHMDAVASMARAGLSVGLGIASILGEDLLHKCADIARDFPRPNSHRWISHLPIPTEKLFGGNHWTQYNAFDEMVYFPTCINRVMGKDCRIPEQIGLPHLIRKLCHRAGFNVRLPENADELCCGLAFASKGYTEAARSCEEKLTDALLKASDGGRLPILCDMSSCLFHMRKTLAKDLRLFEPIEFTMTFLAPRLHFKKTPETVVVHPVCSAKNMGLEDMLLQLAGMCAVKVVVTQTNCCGFAGDRGFTHPELNRHGLRHLAEQLPIDAKRGFSTNRTCEIGLAEESGIPFSSILYLVEECTRE